MTDQVSHTTLKFCTRVLSISDSKRLLVHVDNSRQHLCTIWPYGASSEALTAVQLRGPFSCDIMLSQWVTGSRRFEATYCSHLQGSKCSRWMILDIMAGEGENTKLTRNVENQLASDVPSYPRRTETLRVLIRNKRKQKRRVNARSRKVDH
jgi:hypothetical protein